MNTTREHIQDLKHRRDAVILAHYYTHDEVQDVADHVGDSYYLSKVAAETNHDTIIFCGVSFMGESAKLLSPEKTVIMPDATSYCPMANMADADAIAEMRRRYDDLAVVCYINSTTEVKAASDVCVTSANALAIVGRLPEKNIYFVPDENLGRYIASHLPEKHFIFNDGYCHVHAVLTADAVARVKERYPAAKLLCHPECTQEVLALADYVGSTTGIIEFATCDEDDEFIIGTEVGVLHELRQRNPEKTFHFISVKQVCNEMKKITLDKIVAALEAGSNNVTVNRDVAEQASRSLDRMLEMSS